MERAKLARAATDFCSVPWDFGRGAIVENGVKDGLEAGMPSRAFQMSPVCSGRAATILRRTVNAQKRTKIMIYIRFMARVCSSGKFFSPSLMCFRELASILLFLTISDSRVKKEIRKKRIQRKFNKKWRLRGLWKSPKTTARERERAEALQSCSQRLISSQRVSIASPGSRDFSLFLFFSFSFWVCVCGGGQGRRKIGNRRRAQLREK